MILSYSFVVYIAYVYASPIIPRQAVTALISPPSPPPPGCTGSFPSVFGIAVMNISLTSPSLNSSQALRRRQQTLPTPIFTVGIVNEIVDGQVQGGLHTVAITIETSAPAVTLPPVTEIGDGQIQGPGQTDLSEPQPVAATTTVTICGTSSSSLPRLVDSAAIASKPPTVIEQACGIMSRPCASASQSSPAQVSFPFQADLATPTPPPSPSPSLFPTTSDTDPSLSPSISLSTYLASSSTTPDTPPSPRLSLVSCLTNSTLRLTLEDNNLHDAFNRTGYIASNYQFQFDGPPQSGAIWTSGWSICPASQSTEAESANSTGTQNSDNDVDENIDAGVKTLALGGSTTFWQCLSGEFYNLYMENWAAQCSPVELRITRLIACDS